MNRSLTGLRRAALINILAPVLIVAFSGTLMFGTVSAQDATPEATTIGVLDTDPSGITCETVDGVAAVYAINAEESEARYRAQEELAGRGATEAVGSTQAILAQILLDADGNPMACSRVDVDMRTLESDESRRDNYLRGNTLETDTYPVATFILTSFELVDGSIADGEEANVILIGDLTMHGVTKAVAWEAEIKVDGDTITGTAKTTFDMEDFDITPPTVGPVISIDETVALELDLTLEKSS